jgi:hypothetical protein
MQRSNWMAVVAGGTRRYNPIDGADLACYMADCLLDPAAVGCINKEIRWCDGC